MKGLRGIDGHRIAVNLNAGAVVRKDALRVVARFGRFRNRRRTICVKSREEKAGFDLSGGDGGGVVDTVNGSSGDVQRGIAFLICGRDFGAHHAEREEDAFHGAFFEGLVSLEDRFEVLCGEQPCKKSHGGSRVSHPQVRLGTLETAKADAVNLPDGLGGALDANAHLPKSPFGAEAILARKKVGDRRVAIGDGGKNEHAMG
jgi:hypothetical protein